MKIKILNSTRYFLKENDIWEFVFPSVKSITIQDKDVVDVLDEYSDILDEVIIDLNRTGEREVKIINNWFDNKGE